MSKPNEDSLSQYVRAKLKERHLSRRDVSLRSGGLIAESYVGAIMNGGCANMSMDKLKALSRGLGVDAMELAGIAFGKSTVQPATDENEFEQHSLVLVDLQRKGVLSVDAAEVARRLMHLSAKDRIVVLRFVKRLVRMSEKRQMKGRPPAL